VCELFFGSRKAAHQLITHQLILKGVELGMCTVRGRLEARGKGEVKGTSGAKAGTLGGFLYRDNCPPEPAPQRDSRNFTSCFVCDATMYPNVVPKA
jgi:hypothetical protein